MDATPFVVVDVFAESPFAGNQLAVFYDARALTSDFMQRAANETGYSETTFILPPESSDTAAHLRIFTPMEELPFAGHPLVGSGFVAAVRGIAGGATGVVRFGTGVGPIEVRIDESSDRSGRASMQQPIPEVVAEIADDADLDALAESLGTSRKHFAVDASPAVVMDNGIRVLLLPMASLEAVRNLRPNPVPLAEHMRRLGPKTLMALTTETVSPEASVHCRVFAPGAGVLEDPATGSANGPLGAYLDRYGLVEGGAFTSEQGFEMGRPSLLEISLGKSPTGDLTEVRVGGGVHVTAEGRMFLHGI